MVTQATTCTASPWGTQSVTSSLQIVSPEVYRGYYTNLRLARPPHHGIGFLFHSLRINLSKAHSHEPMPRMARLQMTQQARVARAFWRRHRVPLRGGSQIAVKKRRRQRLGSLLMDQPKTTWPHDAVMSWRSTTSPIGWCTIHHAATPEESVCVLGLHPKMMGALFEERHRTYGNQWSEA
jgi:hypothetical protein